VDVRNAAIEKLDNEETLLQVLLSNMIFFDGHETEKQIKIASILVSVAKKFGPPLKIQWKVIKDWIEKIPVIPHEDRGHEDFYDDDHTDAARQSAPPFPPYPIL
jgi:hypothetical protein